MMQAYSGLMSLLGEDGRPPVRVAASIIDMGAGMWSVIGILVGVAGARPHRHGRGRRHLAVRDGARLDEHLPIAAYLANGEIPARLGSGVEMIVPYQAFAAADGHMMVAAGNRQPVPPPRRRRSAGRASPTTRAFAPTRTASSTGRADPDPRRHLHGRAERRTGRHGSTPPGIPNGPIQTRSTRWSPTRRRWRSALSRNGRATWHWSGLPLSFDSARPPFAKPAPALGEDRDQAIFEHADDPRSAPARRRLSSPRHSAAVRRAPRPTPRPRWDEPRLGALFGLVGQRAQHAPPFISPKTN